MTGLEDTLQVNKSCHLPILDAGGSTMCKYQENTRVIYTRDTDQNHVYIVRDVTPMADDRTECLYNIQLENDPAVQLVDVPESYMTDTVEGRGATGAGATT
jgi:hypothetical protein